MVEFTKYKKLNKYHKDSEVIVDIQLLVNHGNISGLVKYINQLTRRKIR